MTHPSRKEYEALVAELWDLSLCPTGAQLEENFGTQVVTGQTQGRLQRACDLRAILARCDKCRSCRSRRCHDALIADLESYRKLIGGV